MLAAPPRWSPGINLGDSLAEGLRLALPLREAGGETVGDYSGFGNDGTLTNMEETDWVTSELGGALDFGGTDEHVIVADANGIDIGTEHSAVMWIDTTYAAGVFLGHVNFAGGYMMTLAGGIIYYAVGGAAVGVAHGALTAGMQFWGVTRNGPTVKFYRHGVQIGATQTIGSSAGAKISSVGAYRSSTYPMIGAVASVLAYNRTLTPSGMADHFADPWRLFRRPNPLALWAGAAAVAAGGIINQLQGPNVGADLFDGSLL